jgi:hypothetical protein
MPSSDIPITTYSALRLRSPRADCHVSTAEAWIAGILGVPAEAVQLVRPDGGNARGDKTLGALRREWARTRK